MEATPKSPIKKAIKSRGFLIAEACITCLAIVFMSLCLATILRIGTVETVKKAPMNDSILYHVRAAMLPKKDYEHGDSERHP